MPRTSTEGDNFGNLPFVGFTISTIGGYKLLMTQTLEFANAVGRRKMAEALHVLPTAISNAVGRETFPPAWYETCKDLAKEAEVECPPALFGQRPFHNSPSSNAPLSEAS